MVIEISHLQITNDQVASFLSEVNKFNEKFKSDGPASVGVDLDKGMFHGDQGCT